MFEFIFSSRHKQTRTQNVFVIHEYFIWKWSQVGTKHWNRTRRALPVVLNKCIVFVEDRLGALYCRLLCLNVLSWQPQHDKEAVGHLMGFACWINPPNDDIYGCFQGFFLLFYLIFFSFDVEHVGGNSSQVKHLWFFVANLLFFWIHFENGKHQNFVTFQCLSISCPLLGLPGNSGRRNQTQMGTRFIIRSNTLLCPQQTYTFVTVFLCSILWFYQYKNHKWRSWTFDGNPVLTKLLLLDRLHSLTSAMRSFRSKLVVSSAPLHGLGWFDPVFPPRWTIPDAAQSHRWALRQPWKSGALTSIRSFSPPFDTSAELIRFQDRPQPSRLLQFCIWRRFTPKDVPFITLWFDQPLQSKTRPDNAQLAASDEFHFQIGSNEYTGKLDV